MRNLGRGVRRAGLLHIPRLPEVVHPGFVTPIGIQVVRDRRVSGAPDRFGGSRNLRLRADFQICSHRLTAGFDFNHDVRL